jgi:hypothetical protein
MYIEAEAFANEFLAAQAAGCKLVLGQEIRAVGHRLVGRWKMHPSFPVLNGGSATRGADYYRPTDQDRHFFS